MENLSMIQEENKKKKMLFNFNGDIPSNLNIDNVIKKIFNVKKLVKVICFVILFGLHFLGIIVFGEFIDNIVFYGKEYQDVFDKGMGMGVVFIAPIISFFVLLFSFANSKSFEKFYSFFLVVPILCYFIYDIGKKIANYYSIPNYFGIAEIINIAIAIILYVMTKFLFLRIKSGVWVQRRNS